MKIKNGFTLIEILAVIVIISVVVLAAVPAVINISSKIRTNMYCTKIKMVKEAGIIYGQENDLTETCTINSNSYSCKNITIQTLIQEKYIDSNKGATLTDPRDNSSMNTKAVIVYQKNNRYYTKIDASECE